MNINIPDLMNYKLYFNETPGNLNSEEFKFCVSTNNSLLKPCNKPMRQIIAGTFNIAIRKLRY